MLFRDAAGRVLLVKPTYKDGWDIPGGYVEPGESPKHAAAREVDEELGIKPQIGRLLVVDWAPHPDEGDKLLFIFDGGVLANELRDVVIEKREIARAEFVAIEHVAAHLSDRLLERITSSLLHAGDPYLEHGRR